LIQQEKEIIHRNKEGAAIAQGYQAQKEGMKYAVP
jgi:hypothetical protein